MYGYRSDRKREVRGKGLHPSLRALVGKGLTPLAMRLRRIVLRTKPNATGLLSATSGPHNIAVSEGNSAAGHSAEEFTPPCLRKSHNRGWLLSQCGTICALTLSAVFAKAADTPPLLTIRSPHHPSLNAIVTLPVPAAFAQKAITQTGQWELVYAGPVKRIAPPIPCQLLRANGQTTLTFLLPRIGQGETLPYQLRYRDGIRSRSTASEVYVTHTGDNLEMQVMGSLFTRYTTKSGPNKPFFYPILTADGLNLTRRWPVEPNADPAESHDHPHHRGLWFTHSSVNGVDFWSEVETDKVKLGKTVNTGFSGIVSGPVFGGFQATTDWIKPDGKRIATDTRTVRVYPLPTGERLLDFSITIRPDGGPLTFGDNKDGVFGLRVPDSLAVNPSLKPAAPGTGHYTNAKGDKDGAAWGKAAEWVDYWGPIGGQTWGVAMFDSPQNFRHPQTWHARDYGLFTVNPFALHDFKLGDKGAGDFTVPTNGSLTLHYRVLFHKGDNTAAHISDQYATYAAPPEVEAHW